MATIPERLAKIAADQRTNACATPDAVFYGQPITIDDVLASPMIADPLHLLEIVMPCHGGAGVLVANADVARTQSGTGRCGSRASASASATRRPPTPRICSARRSPRPPDAAFGMAGLDRDRVDMASIYDCYTITVLMSLEDAGFCPKGEGMRFVSDHDLTYRGDFPLNTAGGQLCFGQAGMAGGMHHVCDGARQLMGRAGAAQVADCHTRVRLRQRRHDERAGRPRAAGR